MLLVLQQVQGLKFHDETVGLGSGAICRHLLLLQLLSLKLELQLQLQLELKLGCLLLLLLQQELLLFLILQLEFPQLLDSLAFQFGLLLTFGQLLVVFAIGLGATGELPGVDRLLMDGQFLQLAPHESLVPGNQEPAMNEATSLCQGLRQQPRVGRFELGVGAADGSSA